MDPTETQASLRVLLAIAFADGQVVADERRLLAGVAEKLGVPLTIDPKIAGDLDDALAKLQSDEAKKLTFDAAVALASVDGTCAPAEHALLVRIRGALAPDAAIPLEKTEQKWSHRMRDAHARIDHASDAFLDQLATQKDGLSTAVYQAMVADLDRRKTEILRAPLLDE